MKKFNRSIIGLLLCCLVFGACSKKAENEESKKNVKNNKNLSIVPSCFLPGQSRRA